MILACQLFQLHAKPEESKFNYWIGFVNADRSMNTVYATHIVCSQSSLSRSISASAAREGGRAEAGEWMRDGGVNGAISEEYIRKREDQEGRDHHHLLAVMPIPPPSLSLPLPVLIAKTCFPQTKPEHRYSQSRLLKRSCKRKMHGRSPNRSLDQKWDFD